MKERLITHVITLDFSDKTFFFLSRKKQVRVAEGGRDPGVDATLYQFDMKTVI